ncbi:MAG TPA: DUF6263 family protein [Pirellulales bacterium]|nr:DUF6263 family protein [Pirellulales bacterium]
MSTRALFTTATALLLATSTLAANAAAADEAVKLSWKFEKGEKLHYVVEQNTATEAQFAGQSIKNDMKQTLDLEWTVNDVAGDGTAHLTQTIRRVRLKMSQPGAPGVEYDSSSKEAPQGFAAQMAGVYKVLVDKPIKVKMSPLGTVGDVTLPEGLADEMKRSAGPGPAAAMFNEDVVKQMVGGPVFVLADHAVKKGETWKHQAAMSNPQIGGKSTIEFTFTYLGTEKRDGKDFDKIGMSMKMSITPAGAGAPTVEIKSQQSEGDIDFDRAAGRLQKIRTKSKMAMAITAGGTKLDHGITSDNSMRLTDGEDDEKASETEK